eukprot:694334-Rhodomonas_salina.1
MQTPTPYVNPFVSQHQPAREHARNCRAEVRGAQGEGNVTCSSKYVILTPFAVAHVTTAGTTLYWYNTVPGPLVQHCTTGTTRYQGPGTTPLVQQRPLVQHSTRALCRRVYQGWASDRRAGADRGHNELDRGGETGASASPRATLCSEP